jgi:Holliday junction resolvase RusA-like endonuclease
MKRKSPVFAETLICQQCGKAVKKRAAVQKYCEECSQVKDIERKAKWAKSNPLIRTVEQNKAIKEKTRSRNIERGIANNKLTVENISYFPDVDLQWLIKIAIPFSYSGSKNHLWATSNKGHVYRRKESNAVQEQIILMLESAISGKKIYRNKVWIDVFVQKPDHRGDAINFVDLIADAIKVAIGIDDRWFSIRRVDWQIVKENPRIFIGIGQQDLFDAKICSYCGRILPEKNFGKSRRECQECTSQKKYYLRPTGKNRGSNYRLNKK